MTCEEVVNGLEAEVKNAEARLRTVAAAWHSSQDDAAKFAEENIAKEERIAALEARRHDSDRNHRQVIAEQAVRIGALEADLERARANALVLASQNVALEAKLERVRAQAQTCREQMLMGKCPGWVVMGLDAALADEAAPEAKP